MIRPFTLADLQNPQQLLRRMNAMAAELNRLQNLSGGPGIAVQKNAGGIGISLVGGREEGRTGSAEPPDPTGIHAELRNWQGTRDLDYWTRDSGYTIYEVDQNGNPVLRHYEEHRGVTFWPIFDIIYDSNPLSDNFGKLMYRTRAMSHDRWGKLEDVDPEGELVTITTAAPCPP